MGRESVHLQPNQASGGSDYGMVYSDGTPVTSDIRNFTISSGGVAVVGEQYNVKARIYLAISYVAETIPTFMLILFITFELLKRKERKAEHLFGLCRRLFFVLELKVCALIFSLFTFFFAGAIDHIGITKNRNSEIGNIIIFAIFIIAIALNAPRKISGVKTEESGNL
jgi:ABC-type uncharacterized transport system permease subunit